MLTLKNCNEAEKELRVKFERKVDDLLSSKEKSKYRAEVEFIDQMIAETVPADQFGGKS